MATHSSVLAWRIPWTEEPGGLQSIGSQRVRCDRSDSIHIPQTCPPEDRKLGINTPTLFSCPQGCSHSCAWCLCTWVCCKGRRLPQALENSLRQESWETQHALKMGLSQQTPRDITYIRNLKHDTCELIYETDSQTYKTLYSYERGKGCRRDKLGVWD